jgi:hypothetical protein
MNIDLSNWILDEKMVQVAEKAICLTGTARSGTTLLGSIVHSMEKVEYSFEPPMLTSLFLRSNLIDENLLTKLYTEYLYEEILVPAISGRRLNFNSNDWSYIFNAKPIENIKARFNNGNRIRDIYEKSSESKVAYKIPNISHAIEKVVKNYPKTNVLITIRHPCEVARSVMERKWYHGNNLSYKTSGPVIGSEYGNIPACLVDIGPEEWLKLDEEERCHAIYVGCYSNIPSMRVTVIDYKKLTKDPYQTISVFSEKIGLKWGEKTESLVTSVRNNTGAGNNTIESNQKSWKRKAIELYYSISNLHVK